MSVLRARAVEVPSRLAPVSLEVARGEVLALVGPNGAGKSTFLDCVLGLVAHEGALEVEAGVPVAAVPQRLEAPALPVTVGELLACTRTRRPCFLGRPPAVRRAVEAALERVGLAALVERPLSELSGGELRRVLLADALASPSGLLLLDEPEAGLDAPACAWLYEALAGARQAGHAVVWVSHDARAVERHATRVQALGVAR
ncbi:MAG: ATP-binding cassette domain-containing protein [Myxococcaceae bacterium]|jgi:zinc transport system ATP-binding protein|nr:ATP-binding cassette domain-containing protein [Myxococcaceae bacterium]MCA3012777.1 ATP-binding cassette domain-containing protein [Myxococcaceae bacterium]